MQSLNFSIHYFNIGWMAFYVFSFFFLIKWLFKKFHWSFALAITYTILNTYGLGAWVEFAWPYSYMFNLILKEHAQEAIIIILLSVFLISNLKPKPVHFAYLCTFNIILTICLLPFHVQEFHMIGLTLNPAMNASITAITMPFLFFLPDLYIMPFLSVGLILVFATKNFTPILALMVGFFGSAFLDHEKKVRNASILIVVIFVTFLLAHNKNNVIDRMVNWKLFGTYWYHNYNWLIGSGNGSFNLWGPWIQSQTVASDEIWFKKYLPLMGPEYWKDFSGHKKWVWLWLHSDVYQTLFEMGILGVLAWGNAVIHALYRMRRHEAIFSGMLAWLTVACFYFPLHYPVQMLLGVFLISFAIKKEV